MYLYLKIIKLKSLKSLKIYLVYIMQKQIKIWWGRQDLQTENYELTVSLNNEPNSNYYSVSLTAIENEAYREANNKGFPRGIWDFNNIYDEIDANTNMYKENEQIYIRKGFDEEQGDQHNPNVLFAFGNTRLEYFIPASNNNDSSDDDVMADGFVVGGGKYNNLYEVNSHVKVYWRNDNGTYSPHIAKITAINDDEITFAFKNPTYIWRGDPETATDGKGNKLIEKIQREFPRIRKGGRKSRTKKRRTKKRKRKRKRKTRRKRKTKKRKSTKRTRRRR